MDDLQALRAKIDRIDRTIAKALKQRELAVGKIKKAKMKQNLPKVDLKRESEILSNLETEYQKAVFAKIIEESRKLQS